jgi:hypothetical protein
MFRVKELLVASKFSKKVNMQVWRAERTCVAIVESAFELHYQLRVPLESPQNKAFAEHSMHAHSKSK